MSEYSEKVTGKNSEYSENRPGKFSENSKYSKQQLVRKFKIFKQHIKLRKFRKFRNLDFFCPEIVRIFK